jgi:predicted transcriptional regulator
MTNKDGFLLHPDEVKRRRESKTVQEDIKENIEDIDIVNFGDSVKIEYESMNRFDTPRVLHFRDFTNRQLNDLTLCGHDDLLETLISILQENKVEEDDFKIENMTAEDLLETVIAIKQKYESTSHIHYWICDCQIDKDDADRIINENVLNMNEFDYKSIEQVDENMKEFMKDILDNMTDEEFKSYIVKKYKNKPIDDIDSYTREMELERIAIKEPISITVGKDEYTLRYPRLVDVVKAKKYSERKFASKIKSVQNRREANVSLADLKERKKKEIDDLKREQAKLLVLYANSMMIQTKNDKVLSDEEKFDEYSNKLSRTVTKNIKETFKQIDFGLSTELELACPLCGEVSKRRLRDVIDIRQLLPYGDNNRSDTISSKGKQGYDSGFTLHFGV